MRPYTEGFQDAKAGRTPPRGLGQSPLDEEYWAGYRAGMHEIALERAIHRQKTDDGEDQDDWED